MNISFPITSAEILLKCIPQRNPIVMVDTLYAFNDNEVSAGLSIDTTGLFIKNNALQEPGLIEHMAQTVALHTGFGFYLKNQQAPMGYIGSIANLKINRLPIAGEKIHTTATILQEFAGITLVDIICQINNETIATAQMKTVIAK